MLHSSILFCKLQYWIFSFVFCHFWVQVKGKDQHTVYTYIICNIIKRNSTSSIVKIGLQSLRLYPESGSWYLSRTSHLSNSKTTHQRVSTQPQYVSSVYIFFFKQTPSLPLSYLLCRQRPYPAVAVSPGAADRQVLPVLHQLDRRRLGVQAFWPRWGERLWPCWPLAHLLGGPKQLARWTRCLLPLWRCLHALLGSINLSFGRVSGFASVVFHCNKTTNKRTVYFF